MTTSSRKASIAALLLAVACTSTAPPLEPSAPPATTPPTVSPTPARARWERLPDAGVERLEVATGVVEGEIYVAGGLVPGGASAAVEIYDPRARTWRRGRDLPVAVHHAMGVVYRGELVVLGGFPGPSLEGATARAFALRGGAWVELPPMRRPRAAGAAGVVGDLLVVAAGQDGSRLVGETEVFDGERWRDGAAIPTVRDHVAGASDGSFLYVASGRLRSIAATVPAFERYDPARDRWERLPDVPTARGGIGAAIAGEQLLVIGGEGSSEAAGRDGVFPHVEAYDIAARRWSRLPDMPSPRHGIGVAAIEETVYVAAGGPRAGGSYSRRLDALLLG